MLIGPHYAAITPYIGVEIGLKAIAVIVISGTTQISGSLIAGPLIGVAGGDDRGLWRSQERDFVVYDHDPDLCCVRRTAGWIPQDQGQRG